MTDPARALVEYVLSTDRADAEEAARKALAVSWEAGRDAACRAVADIGEKNHVAFHHAPRKSDGTCGEFFCQPYEEAVTAIRALPSAEPALDPATAPIEEVRAELKRRGIDTTKAVAAVLEAVHRDDPKPDRVYWFAEVDPIESPARYLVRGTPGEPAHLTTDPLKATRFDSKHECHSICCGNYVRMKEWKLVPREHMFMGSSAEPAPCRTEPSCAACDHDRATHADSGITDDAGQFGGRCGVPGCACRVFE